MRTGALVRVGMALVLCLAWVLATVPSPAQARAPVVKAKAVKAGATRTIKRKSRVKRTRASKRDKAVVAKRGSKRSVRAKSRKSRAKSRRSKRAKVTRKVRYARPSIGQAFGLHRTPDPLALRSGVALVTNRATQNVLLEKNGSIVLPIASITKLMTAMVILDAELPGQEMIPITGADIDRSRRSASRLVVGTRLSRNQLLQLALMSSENRAANALGRSYPGGMPAFVSAMNAKARLIGMYDTQFVEPTGLSSANVANARDLSRLVSSAFDYQTIREYSTARSLVVDTGYRRLTFRNTNSLLGASDKWKISLQKTGYISEAGRCLVMYTHVRGEPLVMILLDSAGSQSRFGDARRIRRWLEANPPTASLSVQAPSSGS